MPIGYIMMRGQASLRENTLKHLNALIGHEKFAEKTGGMIEDVVATLGWPDFLVTVYSPNVELMKNVIVTLRAIIENLVGDKQVETSTIVGVSSSEIEEKKKRLSKRQISTKEMYVAQRKRSADQLPLRKSVDKGIENSINEWLSKE